MDYNGLYEVPGRKIQESRRKKFEVDQKVEVEERRKELAENREWPEVSA